MFSLYEFFLVIVLINNFLILNQIKMTLSDAIYFYLNDDVTFSKSKNDVVKT